MKLKQLLAFIACIILTVSVFAVTGAVVNKAISIGWYIGLMIVFGVALQIDTDYLHGQISDGEWL